MSTELERARFLEEQDAKRGRSLRDGFFFTHLLHLLSFWRDKYDILPSLDIDLVSGLARPDIAICHEREINWQMEELFETEPPVSVFEIVSPKKSVDEISGIINRVYLPGGVMSVWVVFPEKKKIELWTVAGKKEIFDSGTLTDPATGIQLEIEKVFEGLK